MKNSEIRALSVQEIEEKIKGEHESLQKLRFANAISPIENPNKIREARKLIARLKTALNSKNKSNADV